MKVSGLITSSYVHVIDWIFAVVSAVCTSSNVYVMDLWVSINVVSLNVEELIPT